MSNSATKRSTSFSYGPAGGPTSLPTPDWSPTNFVASAGGDSHPSPLLLPNASLPPPRSAASSSTGPAPKSKSKAAAKSQRKINHSIIEKRRREKINGCLAELRSLVPVDGSDGSGDGESKGEFKLEILVRTVDYVKELQRKIRLLEVSQGTSSTAPVRMIPKTGDQSPWQGIETESEGGLSPAGGSDMSIDEAEASSLPPSASIALPSDHLHGPLSSAHSDARRSLPSSVPIGLQRLPSISLMLPPSQSSAGHSPPSHFARSRASFSTFADLPGARADFDLRPPLSGHALERTSARSNAPPPQIVGSTGGKDELRAAEVLLAISSPELRGVAGGPDEELEDWSLGGRLLGA